MAQKNRADILALINAYTTKVNNFITTNGNREITGAKLNEILNDNGNLLNDIKDSYYSLLDDLADAVNYTPTVPLDWNVTIPTQVKAGLDQLANRLRDLEEISGTDNIAYVSQIGNNATAVVGNQLFPFSTFAAAISAVPTSNSRVVSLGGTFAEDIVIGAGRNNFVLDITGTTINGSIKTTNSSSSNITIIANGGKVTSSTVNVLIVDTVDSFVIGGIFESTGATNYAVQTTAKTIFFGTKFNSTSTARCLNTAINSIFISCSYGSLNNDTVYRTNNSIFLNCSIANATQTNKAVSTQNTASYFSNCNIKGLIDTEIGLSLNGVFENCRITSTGSTIKMRANANAFFKRCQIHGVDAVDLTVTSQAVANNAQSQFIGCELFATTGQIFKEPVSNTITGKKVYSINNVYNKAFTPILTNEQRVFEFNKLEITDLVQSPIF